MPKLSKMQIRADVLNILSKYLNDKNPSSEQIAFDINLLNHIDDKKQVAKILFKEIANNDLSQYTNVCSIMLLEAIDNDTFEDIAVDFLQNKDNSDEKKFLILSLIKQKGIYFDYEDIDKYIQNPEEVAQNGIQGFLLNTIDDPEVQIDLLDFFLNIPKNEKISLLNNILQEGSNDSIAHTLSILSRITDDKDELDIIINFFLESDSAFAIEGIECILKKQKINLKIRQRLKKQLKTLKEKYPDFKNDGIIKNSSVNDSYISFIDGNSNFSLVLSRKMNDNSIDTVLLTINITSGIIACMGFGNISNTSYTTIVRRLFPDSLPVKISPMALKALYKYYKDKNIETNTELPYELIAWSKLFDDIEDINYDLNDFIISKLDSTNLNEDKVKKFITSKTTESWYYNYGQNQAVDYLIDKIEKEHIREYEKIDELADEITEKYFINNDEFMTEIKRRLILNAYISHLAKFKPSSKTSYSLCFKNSYFKMFIKSMIYKSIYQYLLEASDELEQKPNIFKRGKKSGLDKEELDEIMAQIEEKWT